MELVLPNNCVEIEDEEMMYLDGGSGGTFYKNIRGLVGEYFCKVAIGATFSQVTGWNVWGTINKWLHISARILQLLKNPYVAGICAMAGTAAVIWLWNCRVFY